MYGISATLSIVLVSIVIETQHQRLNDIDQRVWTGVSDLIDLVLAHAARIFHFEEVFATAAERKTCDS
jgi:hypothetical protein